MDNRAQHPGSIPEFARLMPQFVLVFLVLLFFPTFVDLSGEWTQWDQSLSHAYPLLVGFVFLLYRVSPLAAMNQYWLIDLLLAVALVVCSLLWFLFHVIQIKILEQLILLPVLYCMIAFVFGVKTLWDLRFLLIMPLFALPIWDYLNSPLVQLSSAIVGEMVRMIKIPALIDGSSIFIPSGHIMIADGCSGLRYLIISLALGYTISYLNGYKEKGLILSLSIAALLGLVANWLRIFFLILIGYYSEMESSLMKDHEFFGWVLFAIICFPAIYFAPVIKSSRHNPIKTTSSFAVKKLLLLGLLLLPGSLLGYLVSFDKAAVNHEHSINANVWRQTLVAAPLSLALPAAQKQLQYTNADNVYLQVNQYQPASGRQRLVPYIPRQYNPEYWVLEKSRLIDHQGKELRAETFRQKSGLKKIIQLQWFDVGGSNTAVVATAKLLQIPAVLTGKLYFSIFTLQLHCEDSSCQQDLQQLLSASEKVY